MKVSRFFTFVGVLFVIALLLYIFTTPHANEIPLTGIVMGNEVVVSPQIAGHMIHLAVNEGSEVHKDELIAQLDPAALRSTLESAESNVKMLEAKVASAERTYTWTDQQTAAAVTQAQATLTSIRAQLQQAQANLWRDQLNFKRAQGLFEGGVIAAQDRDTADAAYRSSDATVKSFEDQVRAAEAALAVSEANRKQVGIQQSELTATRAQLAQSRHDRDTAQVQLGYTDIYAPESGIVSVRAALQGEVLQPGAPIVTILDVDHLWVQADVEESYIDAVQFGQKMKVRFPSGDEIEGTVTFKGVENGFATQRDVSRTKRDITTFSIKVAIPNPQRRLFSGMTAYVLLPPLRSRLGWWGRLGEWLHPAVAR